MEETGPRSGSISGASLDALIGGLSVVFALFRITITNRAFVKSGVQALTTNYQVELVSISLGWYRDKINILVSAKLKTQATLSRQQTSVGNQPETRGKGPSGFQPVAVRHSLLPVRPWTRVLDNSSRPKPLQQVLPACCVENRC